MPLITIDSSSFNEVNPERSRSYCRELEAGQILYFPNSPIVPPDVDLNFLLEQHQSSASYHKNVAYRPHRDKITGLSGDAKSNKGRLTTIMRNHSRQCTGFLNTLLSPYSGAWSLDYGSFRPKEEEGRQLRLRARNDLLHIDAFPTRPTNGDRILRLFTNINPHQSRRWVTTETFDVLVTLYASSLLPVSNTFEKVRKSAVYWVCKAAQSMGLPLVARSPYDDFMLRFHHSLKENQDFQIQSPKYTWDFPPYSSWIAFTDMVPHAVLSGQYALEQTYILSRKALLSPEKAPANVLEDLCGVSMVR